MTDRGDARQTDEGFSNRMVKALTRVEGRLRHATVTLDVSYEDDARRPATIEGELASSSDRQPDGGD
jgi:hypothetical protein